MGVVLASERESSDSDSELSDSDSDSESDRFSTGLNSSAPEFM